MAKEDIKDDINIEQILIDLGKKYPILEQVSFNEFTVRDKQSEQVYLLMFYQDLLCKEKIILDEIKEIKDALVGKKYHHYRFNMDESLTKAEIEQYYLPQDADIRKINKILKKQEIKVKFFESCVSGMEKLGWAIKNFLEANRM